jgi:hypothetical protein
MPSINAAHCACASETTTEKAIPWSGKTLKRQSENATYLQCLNGSAIQRGEGSVRG